MRILISGCSFPAGIGLQNPNECVDKIIAKEIDADVDNISVAGRNNEEIFLYTQLQLIKSAYDRVYVFWTSSPRYKFYPELDFYPYPLHISPAGSKAWQQTTGQYLERLEKINSNEGLKIKKPEQLFNTILLLNHDWHWIMNIVKYTTILADNLGVRFINSICPWDKGFWPLFEKLDGKEFTPDQLTPYAQQLLNVSNRDDIQINKIFQTNMITEYKRIGNIQTNRWLNLENSWNRNKQDLGSDNMHPGPNSHQWMAKLILKDLGHQF